jgi:4-hydroxythreonine-4-phosphate dehydrogenase
MGCPAGIGPEIICRLWARPEFAAAGQAVVVGDLEVLQRTANLLDLHLTPVAWQPGAVAAPGTLPVLQVGRLAREAVVWGRPNIETGAAMASYIETAVQVVRQGRCGGLVTCPISKKSLQQAGYPYPGHTEMLASLTGASQVRMMMAGPRLKVVLVTIHEALSRVPARLTTEEITNCIGMTADSLRRDFALDRPRIAVAGLNPHAGEEGLFGDEEDRLIRPAVAATSGAAEVSGPWPPDTVFHQAAAGRFDAVVAMYHDQGLIPFKLLHFADGVNLTLGLPLVRTSVDHGTAYDIAGKGLADPSSLLAAVTMARQIVANRARSEAL